MKTGIDVARSHHRHSFRTTFFLWRLWINSFIIYICVVNTMNTIKPLKQYNKRGAQSIVPGSRVVNKHIWYSLCIQRRKKKENTDRSLTYLHSSRSHSNFHRHYCFYFLKFSCQTTTCMWLRTPLCRWSLLLCLQL